jgi:hypothetical protein
LIPNNRNNAYDASFVANQGSHDIREDDRREQQQQQQKKRGAKMIIMATSSFGFQRTFPA